MIYEYLILKFIETAILLKILYNIKKHDKIIVFLVFKNYKTYI